MTGFYEGTGGTVEPIPHDLDYHDDVFVSNPSDGQILVYNATDGYWENVDDTAQQVSISMEDLTDTGISAPTEGQVIAWDAGSSKWVNATPSGSGAVLALGELTDVTLTAVTQNDRLVYDGGQWVNTGSEQATANPITIGDGANDTNATLILNAGATPSTDYARIEYQNGGTLSYRQGVNLDAAGNPQFYTVDFQNGEGDPKLVSLIWRNPETPTLNEFALANKTQFRIYKGTGTTAQDRELESFGQGTTANGFRVIDASTGAAAAHMTSTDTYNEVLLNRKNSGVSAIRLRTSSTNDNSYIELDGQLNFVGGNSSTIQKDGIAKIDFDDADKIRFNGEVQVEDQLRLLNINRPGIGYTINGGDIFGVNILGIAPDANNSGFLIRAKSSGGAFYDLVGSSSGALTWRGNPVLLSSQVRTLMEGVADILNANAAQKAAIDQLLTSEGI